MNLTRVPAYVRITIDNTDKVLNNGFRYKETIRTERS